MGLECQYNREQKKRGKASRKDLVERGGKESEPPTPTHQRRESKDTGRPTLSRKSTAKGKARRSVPPTAGFMPSVNGPFPYASPNDREAPRAAATTGLGVMGMDDSRPFYAENAMAGKSAFSCLWVCPPPTPKANLCPEESGENSADYTGSEQSFSPNAEYFANYHHVSDSFQSRMNSTSRPTLSSQPLQPVFKSPEVADPFQQNWQHPISSSQAPYFQNPFPTSFDSMNSLRYPVLEPVLSYLDQSIVPLGLACDLLEFYFSSSSASYQHPLCPFILGYVVRKRSVLHPVSPRKCQPALLASMLWVAAQTSDASSLSSAPSARAQICRHLHQLTMDLLKTLVQGTTWEMLQTNQSIVGGMHFNHNNNAMDIDAPSQSSVKPSDGILLPSGNGPPVCLDDIIAFIHLATAMSASEYKATSIRWWTIAWALAREMKLGRELSDSDPAAHAATAEHKEERRKVWWLLFMVDRHLALCYNRPFHLLDSECADLQLPMDEGSWEMGDFDNSQKPPLRFDPDINQFQCRGHSVYHFFLPLMTILGDIVSMHHEKYHPRLGERFQPPEHWTAKAARMSESLGLYEQSLRAFHRSQRRAAQSRDDYQLQQKQMQFAGQQMPRADVDLQTRIILTYGTYIMHVLHVLLAGKWDPISLLEDSDSWISSQSFLEATSHAVSAAEALGEILELDPGLEFMPFFMGIYLLQGSFLLLLIADKLRGEADEEVLKACETIIRAHDACVATLSTDYQVCQRSHWARLYQGLH